MPNGSRITVPTFGRLTDWCGVWAIEPRAGSALWQLAQRTDLPAHMQAPVPGPRPSPVNRSGSVAVLSIRGAMLKGESSFGGTSTVRVRQELRKAAADPEVSAILLAIDSPGGTVSGTDDLAADVRAANRRKPVVAFIEDTGASAAYWIASQASAVYANSPTALVGSIGTLLVVYDVSQAAEQAGIKTLVLATGDLKGTATPGAPVTAAQTAYLRGLVDSAQAAFDAAVRTGRKMTAAQLAAVRSGEVFPADAAVRLGLVDGIRSIDSVLSELRAPRGPATFVRGASMDELVTLSTDPTADAVQTERARVAKIAAVAGSHPDILRQAIDGGWTPERAENAVLRAKLAPGNGIAAYTPNRDRSGGPGQLATLEAGLLLRLGVNEKFVANRYGEQVTDAATASGMRRVGLQDACKLVLAANGKHVPPGRLSDDDLRSVFEIQAQGFSTLSLPSITGNVANQAMLESFTGTATTWQKFCRSSSVANFKTHTRYRMTAVGTMEKVGPAGEIKHITLSEASATNTAETYGAMIAITRHMIVNDDLSALQDLPQRFGRMAAIGLEKAVYTLLLANTGSFFAAGNRNLLTGAGSALALAGLDDAVEAFFEQYDANNTPILIEPKILLVPSPLYATARNLMNSQAVVGSTTANTLLPDGNPWRGLAEAVQSPFLGATHGLTGNSDIAWYLLTGPGPYSIIDVAFLDGMQTPTIQQGETDFNTLGMQLRCFWDWGVAFLEFRGGVKSAGS